MKSIANKPRMTMKECVDFLGFSRQKICRLIAMTIDKKMEPPFPFIDVTGSKKRHIYYFDREAVAAWVDARSFG